VIGVDWENVGYAGSFVLGSLFGAIAAVRLTRSLLEVVIRVRRRVEDPEPPP
jgi:hypothetical protein